MSNQPPVEKPKLYVKGFCPWCWMAEKELKRLGVTYETINVSKDRSAFDEMLRLSGQTCAPTLVVNGEVLPDFGPEELEPFLKEVGLI